MYGVEQYQRAKLLFCYSEGSFPTRQLTARGSGLSVLLLWSVYFKELLPLPIVTAQQRAWL
jgi:hypothetical protein